ncbi:MAG TPA: TetR/AcrR family transcriptional regulator [Gemmatimonadaceae bacterium]
MSKEYRSDRRVRRTRNLLHGALVSLIHQKPYDDIVVKEILARANVGRSTFYTHFRDKDDLLRSGIREMLRAGIPVAPAQADCLADHVLRFSLPLFEHIQRYHAASDVADIPSDAPGKAVVHQRLEQEVTELVDADLQRLGYEGDGRGGVPRTLLAQQVASTFRLVLRWWLEHDDQLSLTRADHMFRDLARPVLTAALERKPPAA